MVYDSEVDDFVMLKNSSCKILNGASFKVVLKKVRILLPLYLYVL